MPILYHLTPLAQVTDILHKGLVPQIGERSKLAGETQPAIFCFPSLAQVEDALMQWVGDYFDEDEPLALLRIAAPDEVLMGEGAGYEVVVLLPIAAASIEMLYEDQSAGDRTRWPGASSSSWASTVPAACRGAVFPSRHTCGPKAGS